MFIFWGPFFFFFPILIIYFVMRSLSGPSRHGGSRNSFFWPENRFDPFGHWGAGAEDEHSLRVRVYKLAYKLEGTLTVSDIVVETGLDVDEAEQLIQSMVDNQRVRMEVKDDGMIVYEFPEIKSRYLEKERVQGQRPG